jgi:hypothetical protein
MQISGDDRRGLKFEAAQLEAWWQEITTGVVDRPPPHASDFTSAREFVPGEAPEEWDGLNAPPSGAGILWVDVDIARADLQSLQQILPRLCPGMGEEEITDLFWVDLEPRLEDGTGKDAPAVSVIRSFEGWLITAWHRERTIRGVEAAVDERWQELGPVDARTAGDLAALFIETASQHCGYSCRVTGNGLQPYTV